MASLGFVELNQYEKVMLLKTRYMINKTYAAAKAENMQPNTKPLALTEKNSSIRYPLITMTKPVTSHENVC